MKKNTFADCSSAALANLSLPLVIAAIFWDAIPLDFVGFLEPFFEPKVGTVSIAWMWKEQNILPQLKWFGSYAKKRENIE